MMPGYRLSIIVAVEYAQANLPAIMDRLAPGKNPQVEFLICHSEHDRVPAKLTANLGNVCVLPGQPGSRIPHLWRDGIQIAQAGRIATTTAHCIPAADWVERLLNMELSGDTVTVGGVIANDHNADTKSWAIFMLRYMAVAPPQMMRELNDVAADNALYNRGELLRHSDLLEQGFWEPSFHSRFRDAGLQLRLDPELKVTHHNLYSAARFFRQRMVHGREFGVSRGLASSHAKRWLLLVLCPALPFIFLLKILRRVRKGPEARAHLLGAFPWLLWFLVGWGLGEARGYLAAVWSKMGNPVTGQT